MEIQEFINHPVNIKTNIIISSNTISLYTGISSILDINVSANMDLKAKTTIMEAIAKFKFLSKTVDIIVSIILNISDIRLTLSITFSCLKVLR